jgi:hypothetical protein
MTQQEILEQLRNGQGTVIRSETIDVKDAPFNKEAQQKKLELMAHIASLFGELAELMQQHHIPSEGFIACVPIISPDHNEDGTTQRQEFISLYGGKLEMTLATLSLWSNSTELYEAMEVYKPLYDVGGMFRDPQFITNLLHTIQSSPELTDLVRKQAERIRKRGE